MAALLSLSFFILVLGIGLAVPPSQSVAKNAKPVVLSQQTGAKQELNSAPHKKVTIGDPLSTVATLTGGGAPKYHVHDSVRKYIAPQPDSHRIINDHYKKYTTVQDNLKTAAKGTNVGDIHINREFDSAQVRDIVHKEGRTVTTTKGEHHRKAQFGVHRKITEANRNAHTDISNSCEACDKTSRSVNEGKNSALIKSREDKGEFTTNYMESDTKIHDKDHTDTKSNNEMSFKHENQQKTGTMQIVHDRKDNLMVGDMNDVHTQTVTGHHDAQTATREQVSPIGKIAIERNVKRDNFDAADIQEHHLNAYHEAPLRTFVMRNKQVRDDRFRHESVDAHYDTEVERKGGLKVNAHIERKTNFDSSRLQHVDELNIKVIPKVHPEQLSTVRLQNRIVDRDRLDMNEHNHRNTVTTMPDGGKRTMSIKEDHVLSKNLQTTPTDNDHVDHTLPISEQVHKVEKTVVPTNKELMTPLVHHYKIKKN